MTDLRALLSVLRFAPLALASVVVAGCFDTSTSTTRCNEYDHGSRLYASSCEGDVLVSTTSWPLCPNPNATTTSRVDCAVTGGVCVSGGPRVASCVHYCASNDDCEGGEFCAAGDGGKASCAPRRDVRMPCEASNAKSCMDGVACLRTTRTDDPTFEAAFCGRTCRSDADCGEWDYCSSVVVTADGARTCAYRGGDCDPSSPTSCFEGATCRPSGRKLPTGDGTTRDEHWCAP